MIYDLIATLLRPVAWWGRLTVEGLETVPAQGPVLVVPNHDSQWDPVRERAVEALRSGEAVCVIPEGGLSWCSAGEAGEQHV
jgi:hypothetical protein